jgi:hypothetical protein
VKTELKEDIKSLKTELKADFLAIASLLYSLFFGGVIGLFTFVAAFLSVF